LRKKRSKLAKPGRAYRITAGVSTGVASFNGDLLIGIFFTGSTLAGQVSTDSCRYDYEALRHCFEGLVGREHGIGTQFIIYVLRARIGIGIIVLILKTQNSKI